MTEEFRFVPTNHSSKRVKQAEFPVTTEILDPFLRYKPMTPGTPPTGQPLGPTTSALLIQQNGGGAVEENIHWCREQQVHSCENHVLKTIWDKHIYEHAQLTAGALRYQDKFMRCVAVRHCKLSLTHCAMWQDLPVSCAHLQREAVMCKQVLTGGAIEQMCFYVVG